MNQPKENHPIADCWPMMNPAELAQLSDSIKKSGLIFPIILHEGKILDGRNRYRACQLAGVTPRFEPFNGDDAVQYARNVNENRRHETPSQRAMIAGKLATLKHGSNQNKHTKEEGSKDTSSTSALTTQEAADLMKVGEAQVKRARRILRESPPEVIAKIESGELSVREVHRNLVSNPEPITSNKGAKPVKEKKFKYISDLGNFHGMNAKIHLQKILKEDIHRVDALQKIVAYCNDRLTNNK